MREAKESATVPLSGRIWSAVTWTLIGKAGAQVLSYVRVVVLARLLDPYHFGLAAVGLLAISTLEALTKPGIYEALVQREDLDLAYLDTVWLVAITRTALIGALAAAAAPWLTSFLGSPDSAALLQAMALGAGIRGLCNPAIVVFQRQLDYRPQAILEGAPVVADLTAAVAIAMLAPTAWALVGGYIANCCAYVVVSHLLCSHRPKLRWNRGHAVALHRFGRWIYLTNLVTFLGSKADSLVVGAALGPTGLAIYEMGHRVALAVLQIPRALGSVQLAAFSRLQSDTKSLSRALFTAQLVTGVGLSMAVLAVWCTGDRAFYLILGEKWAESFGVARLLCAAAVLRGLCVPLRMVMAAVGQPHLPMIPAVVGSLLLPATAVPAASTYGAHGVAGAACLTGAIALAVSIVLAGRITGVSTRILFVCSVAPPALALIALFIPYAVLGRPWNEDLPVGVALPTTLLFAGLTLALRKRLRPATPRGAVI